MADRKPIRPVAPPPLRPVRFAAAHGVAATLDPDLARLRRLAFGLAALALPVLGIACADRVPRAGLPGATQAAAPQIPSPGAAAALNGRPARTASLGPLPGGAGR